MSNRTIFGISAGAIIGIGGAATNVGNIPSWIILALTGVNDPQRCLEWIKNPTEAAMLHPCFPVTSPPSLGVLSNILVFVALFLIGRGAVELLSKSR